MNVIRTTGLSLALAAGGCASVAPPAELVGARSAYDRAAHGLAAQLAPADLHSAREMLVSAERSFDDGGDTPETKDLAYAATRRAELAESRARTLDATRQRDRTLAEAQAEQAAAVRQTAAALGNARQQIAMQGRELSTERQRREAAEKRTAKAMADLASIASIKQDARGLIITLSGSVLFVSGKSDLLPTAQAKLTEVAAALLQDDSESSFVVEGHTDSRGSATLNQTLSQQRAEAVRAYLIGRGVPADRITAQGFGPSRPVADNVSPEGRADNRRVEIVVRPPDAR